MQTSRRGIMLVIASPSGAGKTSITRTILNQDANTSLSVSVTTRKRRTDEMNHVHYHFIDVAEFQRMRDAGELLESAEVHDNFYGTPRGEVEDQLAAGRDIIFDIDYQGTLQLYERCRDDMVTIFILPPSIAELRSRLLHRAQDSDEVIDRRLRNARKEMAHWHEYDTVLINADLQESCDRVAEILKDARQARTNPGGLAAFVAQLRARRDSTFDFASFVKGLQDEIDSI
ncbi:MAG TPA: guanylate kinase [Devosiaceae bacterium]